jgi:hypothetical protein
MQKFDLQVQDKGFTLWNLNDEGARTRWAIDGSLFLTGDYIAIDLEAFDWSVQDGTLTLKRKED